MNNNTMPFLFPNPVRGDMILKLLQEEMRSEFALKADPIMDLLDGKIGGEYAGNRILWGYDNTAKGKGCPMFTVWTHGLPVILPLPKKYAGRPLRILLDVDTEKWNPHARYESILFVVTCHRRCWLPPWRHDWYPVDLDKARYVRVCLDNIMYHLRARLGWLELPSETV